LGGFTPAAEKLQRSQSTISYPVERVEEQLGIELFESRGRKACPTEAARALLATSEPELTGGLESAKARVANKSGCLEFSNQARRDIFWIQRATG
jgi:DNA-binding transcriptional LysR family regulator